MAKNNELSQHVFRENVYTALKQWHETNRAGSALESLQLFRAAQQEYDPNPWQAANRVLLAGIALLESRQAPLALLLRLRFLDRLSVYATANRLNIAESTVYTQQRQAIDELAQILYNQELTARQVRRSALEERLDPPTYTELIGVEKHLAQLQEQLVHLGAPWILAIEGLGGIGKTSLADALFRSMLEDVRFADFGWVTARQMHFDLGGGLHSLEKPALTTDALVDALIEQLMQDAPMFAALESEKKRTVLRERLKEDPHLIVIDNLETLTDVETLLPLLRTLINPSKFLLTSRQRYDAEPLLYHFTVPTLNERNALCLVRQEAALRNLPHLANASDAALRPIYATVGGNPLALRLIVGQTYTHSLDVILADLQTAQSATVENLYTYIYRRAWDHLGELGQRVLLVMPLVGLHGQDLHYISDVSGLERSAVRTALDALVQQNLVNCHGDLNDRRYTIHSLTRTFLQEQVARWL